jgi:hypothetical protein
LPDFVDLTETNGNTSPIHFEVTRATAATRSTVSMAYDRFAEKHILELAVTRSFK